MTTIPETHTSLTFGFEVPQTYSGPGDLETLRRVAIAAEAAGFADVWLSDAATGGPMIDPLTLLPYLAAITSRVRIGVSVIVLPVHHPIHFAKRIASIDVLSAGRVTIGIGLGSTWDRGYGVAPERKLAQYLDVFRGSDALLRDAVSEYTGGFDLEASSVGPKSVQEPRPPIWFGATAEAGVRRAARLADGWMAAGASDIDTFERNGPLIRAELERLGRDPATFPISKRVYFAVEGADAPPRPEGGPRPVVWHSSEECLEYLGKLERAGATHVLFNPVSDFEQQLEAVLPYLRQAGSLA